MQFSATQVFGRQLTILSAFCVVSVVVVVDPVGRVSAWRTRSPRAMSCSRVQPPLGVGRLVVGRAEESVPFDGAGAALRRTLIQGVAGEDVDTTLLEAELEFAADGRKRRLLILHTGAYSTDFPGLHTLILADTRYRMLSVVRFRDEATFLRAVLEESSTSPKVVLTWVGVVRFRATRRRLFLVDDAQVVEQGIPDRVALGGCPPRAPTDHQNLN